jgi:subtilisin family serine protease
MIMAWLLVLTVLIAGAALPAPARAQAPDGYLPAEVVVKLRNAADLPAVTAAFRLDPTPIDQFGSRPIYRLRILDGVDPAQKAAALAADGRIEYAEPNFIAQTPEGRQQESWFGGGGSSEYAGQYAPALMRLPEAHRAGQGVGITVAVLDTGVDLGHPLLAERLVAGFDFVDMDANPSEVGVHGQDPAYGHGTHVAGLVALAAPQARIMPVRVLDRRGAGNIWVLAEALAYAVDPDRNPATADGAQVINLSLGTTRRTNLLAEIVADITCDDDDDDDCLTPGGRGAVVLAAAGNQGTTVAEYPAAEAVEGALAVAASTQMDTLAPFSTRGPWVTIAAPGDRILSSVPGGGYGTWSGTSMATPLTAGVAALIRAQNPQMPATDVTQRILATAVPISGPVPRRVDAAAALGVPVAGSGGTSGTLTCRGGVGAVAVDSVLVPPGATCSLDGTRVAGSVTVERDSSLAARGVHVQGNIQADGAHAVSIDQAMVSGNVVIKKGGNNTTNLTVIAGNLQIEENNGTSTVRGTTIAGNLQVFKNRGGVSLVSNMVRQTLQCKENVPPPTGSGNTAAGKEDQCAGL